MASSSPAHVVVTIALFLGVVMENPQPDASQDVVGVCYGKVGDDLPAPAEVVALYRQHNIGRMRVYSPDAATLQALRRSDIGVVLDVPSKLIQGLASNASAAADWVRRNVVAYWPDVRFRYLAVGNELIRPDAPAAKYVLPAMRNVHAAVSSAGLQNDIKVSTAVDAGVLGSSYPPSAGEFSAAARAYMRPVVQFLSSTGAPLLANIYPYFTYAGNPSSVALSYALFTAPATALVVADGPYAYRNLFDATLDAMYAALEKVGGGDVAIVVSESGWPSAGGIAATVGNAQTYVQNLVRHAPGGTPRRPGKATETYVFAMFNENLKTGAETEKHFGLFYPNKQPVYTIQFV